MRGPLVITLALSLGAHLAVLTALWAPAVLPEPALDPAPQLAGETFELPAPETAEAPPEAAWTPPERASAPADEEDAPTRAEPSVPRERAARPVRPPRASAGGGLGQEGGPGTAGAALYGAVGERSATDLATAFTRGFPQAASADPVWRAAPLGSAGHAEVVLTLGEAGYIESADVLGAPSPALASAVRRTLALIKGRPFVAKGKVTKLHLVADVSADAVHDALHGNVFAIGGSFAGSEGSAFFALAIGRRIDLRVRVR